jgi:hypothetical protein
MPKSRISHSKENLGQHAALVLFSPIMPRRGANEIRGNRGYPERQEDPAESARLEQHSFAQYKNT